LKFGIGLKYTKKADLISLRTFILPDFPKSLIPGGIKNPGPPPFQKMAHFIQSLLSFRLLQQHDMADIGIVASNAIINGHLDHLARSFSQESLEDEVLVGCGVVDISRFTPAWSKS
jgi:hypothetical protein